MSPTEALKTRQLLRALEWEQLYVRKISDLSCKNAVGDSMYKNTI